MTYNNCWYYERKNIIKNIAIFGSTGSIGESTLNVIRENSDLFNVVTLVAGNNIEKLIKQIKDGTIMANIGPKSMQIPIAYALNYPHRLSNNIEKLDLFDVANLQFEKPDLDKFKCLRLAYRALEKGQCYQVILNASNEVLVEAFLNNEIKYMDIANGIEQMLEIHEKRELKTIDEIIEFDREMK
ncbi:MAG: hypothetical protein J6B87_06930 [Clostridia bacterium]|nr:hypothetical protein [Clostridia bacterium]